MVRESPTRVFTAAELVAEILDRTAANSAVLVVSLDGRSGTGKSTLAAAIAPELGATVIPADDFFAAEVPDAEWDRRSPEQRAAGAIDWRRLRRGAIEPLRAGRPARWFAFDFAAGLRPDGTYATQKTATERRPSRFVILDGAYSSRPELADSIDRLVLVEASRAVREARLAAREDAEFLAAWHARWDAAEDHYFGFVRLPASFDLVIDTSSLASPRSG